jgi:hypothetical protein
MARAVTMFTASGPISVPLEELAQRCGSWGFDGLEFACWGDHFGVDKRSPTTTTCALRTLRAFRNPRSFAGTPRVQNSTQPPKSSPLTPCVWQQAMAANGLVSAQLQA